MQPGRPDATASAVGAFLDALTDAVRVLGPDGCEYARNVALTQLCRDEPDHAALLHAGAMLAARLHGLGGLQAVWPPGRRMVQARQPHATRRGTYQLKAILLPPGAFSREAVVAVVIARQARPALPGPEALRLRYRLTRREAEVALLLAEGCANDEIAARLFLSPHTTRRHTANIFDKIGAHTRKALALRFLQDEALPSLEEAVCVAEGWPAASQTR